MRVEKYPVEGRYEDRSRWYQHFLHAAGQCSMDLVTLKVVVLVLLVCVRLSVGLSPLFACRNYHSARSHWVDLTTALCLSFAAGVLLATCFVHLVPQVRAALHYFLPQHTLPITELLIVAGFYLTFFLDEALVSFRSASKVFPENVSETSSPSKSSRSHSTRSHNVLWAFLLSLHSFVVGAAVGLAETVGDVWFLFVAAAVHESVALVSFTLRLMKEEQAVPAIATLSVVVALVMVAGMVVGIVLISTGVDAVLIAVFRGLAAGNILYVTFYELLTREIRARALGIPSYFLSLMGFLLMLVLHLVGMQEPKYAEYAPNCAQAPAEEPDYNNYPEDNQ